MADKRISDLPAIDAAQLDASTDVLAVADISASETKKVTAAALVSKSISQVPDGSINGDKIINGSLPGGKLEPNSITSRELAPNTVETIHVVDSAITNAKLAGNIANDKLAAGIDGSKLQDASVSSDKLIGGITNDQLQGGITGDKIANGQINSNHLQAGSVEGQTQIQDRSIPATKIIQNTLTANEIAPNAIGSSELADGSVDTTALQNDACSTPKYQDASVTDAKLASGINGAKLQDGSITNVKLAGGISGDNINDVPLDKLPNAAGNTVLAGPSAAGSAASPVFRKLVSADLPIATSTDVGVVNVPDSGGLSVTSDGELAINNSVAGNTKPVITYNSHGLVTASRDLQPTDLPPAGPGSLGGVKPGDGISISGDGTISQSLTGVTAGQYTKVTVDERGNVTEGAELEKTDIPNIGYDQIDGSLDLSQLIGEINSSQIADKSVLRQKLSDYAITFIQEAVPAIDPTIHIGCMWFQESTASLNMWNGNSWMSIGQGRLSAENLRYCGLVNANTGLISGVTQFGVTAGFEIGQPVPVASDQLTGVYFVVEVPGDNIAETPGITYDAGDWCLCNGAAAGWVRIDTLNSGGGGGSSRLSDLLDVDVTGASEGSLLQLQSNGLWSDVQLIDAGAY